MKLTRRQTTQLFLNLKKETIRRGRLEMRLLNPSPLKCVPLVKPSL
jgi:hypothetical protein